MLIQTGTSSLASKFASEAGVAWSGGFSGTAARRVSKPPLQISLNLTESRFPMKKVSATALGDLTSLSFHKRKSLRIKLT